MNYDVFKGNLVRLKVIDLDEFAPALAKWLQDSEYSRLEGDGPAMLATPKQVQAYFEKPDKDSYFFGIHALADDRLIGDIALDGIDWAAGNAWLGIGVGDRDYWGKGYGTDAMQVMLRFAFQEMNLHRVTLNVFEYNPRAIRCYEKVGFKHEGRLRGCLNRDGRRWDLVHMGILHNEWEEIVRRQ